MSNDNDDSLYRPQCEINRQSFQHAPVVITITFATNSTAAALLHASGCFSFISRAFAIAHKL
ncbi:hypothetical protein JNB11_03690 [Kocuria palustris]|nr:hypothetical protein [Kocuria palustris]